MVIKSKKNKDIEEFLAFLQLKNYTIGTLHQYRKKLYRIEDMLSTRDISLLSASSTDIYQLILHKLNHYAPSTIANYLSSLKMYYEYAILAEKRPNQPVLSLMYPKIKKAKFRMMPTEDYEDFYEYINKKTSLPYLVALDLLYYCGLRVTEAYNVSPIGDIHNWEHGKYVHVYGKGAKNRSVPITHPRLLESLAILTSAFDGSSSPVLGTTRATITYHLGEWEKKTDKPHYTPHDMRRAYAQHLMEETGDINKVRELLGHDSINTTLHYIDTSYHTVRTTQSNYLHNP